MENEIQMFVSTPDDVPVTLHATLPLGKWKAIRDALHKAGGDQPTALYELMHQVGAVTDRVEANFEVKMPLGITSKETGHVV